MTRIQPVIRTKMHWDRLCQSAGFGHFIPIEWPIHRCAICGKLCRPGWHDYAKFITQARQEDECPLYSICPDHGGEEGKDYVDALTGARVHVGPSPYFIRKALSDWLMEGGYWIGVLIRYV